MPRPLIAAALVGSTLGLGLPAARADLTVNSWNLQTRVREGTGVVVSVTNNTVSNPFSPTHTAYGSGGSSTETIYDSAWDAAGGSFNSNFDHQPDGAYASFGNSFAMISFSVTDVDMPYDLSGAYSMAGEEWIDALVHLRDGPIGGEMLFNWSQIGTIADQSFVVGQGGGNIRNTVTGSPFGTLLAGHTYTLICGFFGQDVSSAPSGATFGGSFHMKLGDRVNIPAPGAALLGIVGLPLVGWFKRRLA